MEFSSRLKFISPRFEHTFYLFLLAMIVLSCNNGRNQNVKFQQYYAQGQQLYLKNCSNCHQQDGSGLARVYPPLNRSDYMDQHFDKVLCLIKYGVNEKINEKGKKTNKLMKGIPSLTELEIAEIATYIYNTWERDRGIVEPVQVRAILSKCER